MAAIAVFGDRANSPVLAKGDRCYVEGRLKLEAWQGRDGQGRQGLKIAAWKVERLGEIGKNKAGAAGGNVAPARRTRRANTQRLAHSQPNGHRARRRGIGSGAQL